MTGITARPAAETTGITVRPPRLLVVGTELAERLARLEALVDTSLDLGRAEASRLRRMADQSAIAREPSTVVYRLSVGGHQQTGVVVEVSIDDYRAGRIRRHEATHPERERRLAELLDAAQVELVPVTLAHPPLPRLRSLLAEVAGAEHDVRVESGDGLVQTVWIGHDPELAHAIRAELIGVDRLYIADGHHRMAVAQRHAGLLHDNGNGSGFVLAALFPCDEMRLLGHHRCVIGPAGSPDPLGTLSGLPAVARIEEIAATAAPHVAPGVVSAYLDGGWYRLWLRPPRDPVDVRASLDVVALEEGILAPLLGVAEVGSDPRVVPVPGTSDAVALARWCAGHQAIGFLLHPPSVDQVMAVSDAGLVLPAKSTWFEPKARAGLFVRDLIR